MHSVIVIFLHRGSNRPPLDHFGHGCVKAWLRLSKYKEVDSSEVSTHWNSLSTCLSTHCHWESLSTSIYIEVFTSIDSLSLRDSKTKKSTDCLHSGAILHSESTVLSVYIQSTLWSYSPHKRRVSEMRGLCHLVSVKARRVPRPEHIRFWSTRSSPFGAWEHGIETQHICDKKDTKKCWAVKDAKHIKHVKWMLSMICTLY